VGSTYGLSKISINSNGQVKIKNYRHNNSDPYSLSHNFITSICEDSNGDMWIATRGGGINKFDIKKEKFYHFINEPGDKTSLSHNNISSILYDKYSNNHIWVGTYNCGLNRLDINSGSVKRYEEIEEFYLHLKNYIFNLYQDASGLIWMAGYGGGVYKFDLYRNKFFGYQPGIGKGKGDIFLGIYVNPYSQEDIIWCISGGGGVLKLNRKNNQYTRYLYDSHHPDYKTRNMFISLYGEFKKNNPEQTILWMGSIEAGIVQFDCETEKFKYYKDDPEHILSRIQYQVRTINPDHEYENILWIGTSQSGLYKYDKRNKILKHFRHEPNNSKSLSHSFVRHVMRDSKKRLWISTYGGGLNLMNETDETFHHYMHEPIDTCSIGHNYVNLTFESSSGQLWIGTWSGIDQFIPKNDCFIHYTEKNGLANNLVYGILEDSNKNLWLSTGNGLSMFDPLKKSGNAFTNYDFSDGLHGNEFEGNAFFKNKSGEMYFAGMKGFTVFNPDHIKTNTYIPNIVITDIRINGNLIRPDSNSLIQQSISQTKQLDLIHSQNNLTFEFAALDYFNPLKNQYAYKMEGIDRDWIYTDASRRFAGYTALDPGEYTFHVKGYNSDGIWNEKGTSLKISIYPPWWQTTWAYLFYLILILSLIIFIWNLQIRRIRLKHQLEMEHIQAEKLSEVDHMKSRFFANISHEFRTPLTLILEPVHSIIKNIEDKNIKKKLDIVYRNANRLKGLVNQLLDISKLEAGKMDLKVKEMDIIPVLRKLVLSFTSMAEMKKITLKFTSKIKSLLVFIDFDKFEKIINNLLSNAIKFSPEKGKVEVQLQDNYLPDKENQHTDMQIVVSNTGSFIPKDQLDKIFDRFYQGHNSNKKDGQGTGIGLALTRELVELHHGSIYVKSSKKGVHTKTIFIITLPLGRERYSKDEIIERSQDVDKNYEPVLPLYETICVEESEIRAEEKEKFIDPPKSMVLLIEDNTDMCRYIRDSLQNDFHIDLAVNGEKGFHLATSKVPDLIISDIMMPNMDGYQVCQKIKSDLRTSHIPVILLTARAELNDKLTGLSLGADDYIPKPFSIDELRIRIKNLIEQREKLRKRFSHDILFGIQDLSFTQTDEQFLENILKAIQQHISDPHFKVQVLSEAIGINQTTLNQKLQALTGQSPHNFIRLIRLKKAALLLRQKTVNVTAVAYEVGYKSLSHFAKAFKEQFGETPSKFSLYR
jgi:signal transduction histidine kinase/DNA-binding response OmpR family regulator/ligand-binding sensor domain-containing protein